MGWRMCIVSVVAQGLYLCSASLYSFVKCGFRLRSVGRVQGGRWQQHAALPHSRFLLFMLSSCLPCSLCVSQWAALCVQLIFLKHDVVYQLAFLDLAQRGWHWSSQRWIALACSFTGPCCTQLGVHNGRGEALEYAFAQHEYIRL